MRSGCSMESSMSRRSLMMGKLRTEESRNEIRKRPGAPRVPAKVTSFCFQPDRPCCKEKTSVTIGDSLAGEWGRGYWGAEKKEVEQGGYREKRRKEPITSPVQTGNNIGHTFSAPGARRTLALKSRVFR